MLCVINWAEAKGKAGFTTHVSLPGYRYYLLWYKQKHPVKLDLAVHHHTAFRH